MPDLSAQLLDGESEAERILDDEFADFAFQIDEYQLQARMSRLRSRSGGSLRPHGGHPTLACLP